MQLIHRAADYITRQFRPEHLESEVETIIALREGKDVNKVDGHSLQEAIESINMMAHLLAMAALPAINVSIFTPSQQECLMYATGRLIGSRMTASC